MSMLKITYTNGDIQNINVTGDFFTITLAPKNGKQVKMSPLEKAEDLAMDLAVTRNSEVSKVFLYYPNGAAPKISLFRPEDPRERMEKIEAGKSFIKALKAMKKEWRHRKHTQRWVWQF